MSYEFTKLSNVPAVSEFPEGANTIIEANGEIKRCPSSNTPKPLTYDYMPEGYPRKSVQTTTLMEEQEVIFTENGTAYTAVLTDALILVAGQTYTVNWDGTEYECVSRKFNNILIIGNLSIFGLSENSGEPFLYVMSGKAFTTLDTSSSHTISIKTTEKTVTPMAEELLPNIPADKLPTSVNSTTVFYI